MDFDGLCETIERLQERIKASASYIGRWEIRTRVSLIDPMLCALGWEVGDPNLVRIETPDQEEGRPDYELLNSGGKPVVLIEAKRLSAAVDTAATRQVLRYVTAQNMDSDYKVPFCACTNGDAWRVYTVLAQQRVFDLSLSRERSEDCAFKLLGLWQRSLVDGSLRTAVQANSLPTSLGTDVNVQTQARQPTISAPGDQAGLPPSGWTRLTPDFAPAKGKQPVSVWLPSGEVTVKYWRDVIIRVVAWLLQSDLLKVEMLPIHMGRANSSKRYLMNVRPKHPDGTAFSAPKEFLSGSVYLEAHLAPREIVQLARKLLDLCHTPGSVGLKF